MASSTIVRLTDEASVPAREAHTEPVLLQEDTPSINLGVVTPVDILHAIAKRKRIDFVTTDEDKRSVVGVSVRSVKPGMPGSLVCIVELVRSSPIQLRTPMDTVAIMTVDMETGQAMLSCQRIGLARVTRVTEESIHSDGTWITSLLFDGVTSNWGSDVPYYKVNQQVAVRVTAEGRLVEQ